MRALLAPLSASLLAFGLAGCGTDPKRDEGIVDTTLADQPVSNFIDVSAVDTNLKAAAGELELEADRLLREGEAAEQEIGTSFDPPEQSSDQNSSDGVSAPATDMSFAEPTPARARTNLASYISNDDYPADALRYNQQGRVSFVLSVGPDGRVSDCRVTSSSGSSSLDGTTCRLMQARARFNPAVGSDGSRIKDEVRASIIWSLGE